MIQTISGQNAFRMIFANSQFKQLMIGSKEKRNIILRTISRALVMGMDTEYVYDEQNETHEMQYCKKAQFIIWNNFDTINNYLTKFFTILLAQKAGYQQLCINSCESVQQKVYWEDMTKFLYNSESRRKYFSNVFKISERLYLEKVEKARLSLSDKKLRSYIEPIYDKLIAGKLMTNSQQFTQDTFNYIYTFLQLNNHTWEQLRAKISTLQAQSFIEILTQSQISQNSISLKAYLSSLTPFSKIRFPAQPYQYYQQVIQNGRYDILGQYRQPRYNTYYRAIQSDIVIASADEWENILKNVDNRIVVINYSSYGGVIKNLNNDKIERILSDWEDQNPNQLAQFQNRNIYQVVLNIKQDKILNIYVRYLNVGRITSQQIFSSPPLKITLSFPKILVSLSLTDVQLTNLTQCTNLCNFYSDLKQTQAQLEYYNNLANCKNLKRICIHYYDVRSFINVLNKLKAKQLIYINITDLNSQENPILKKELLNIQFFNYQFASSQQLKVHIQSIRHPILIALFQEYNRRVQLQIITKFGVKSDYMLNNDYSSIDENENYIQTYPLIKNVQFGSLSSLKKFLGDQLYNRIYNVLSYIGKYLVGPPDYVSFIMDLFQTAWKERRLFNLSQNEQLNEFSLQKNIMHRRIKGYGVATQQTTCPQSVHLSNTSQYQQMRLKVLYKRYKIINYLNNYVKQKMVDRNYPKNPERRYFDRRTLERATAVIEWRKTSMQQKLNFRQQVFITNYQECLTKQVGGVMPIYDYPARFLTFQLLYFLAQIPRAKFEQYFNIVDQNDLRLIKPFTKIHEVETKSELRIISTMTQLMPRSNIVLKFSNEQKQNYKGRARRQEFTQPERNTQILYNFDNIDGKYLKNLFNNLQLRLQSVSAKIRFVMVKQIETDTIWTKYLSEDSKTNPIAVQFLKELHQNCTYDVMLRYGYVHKELCALRMRHLTFINSQQPKKNENNKIVYPKTLSIRLQLPEHLVSLTLENAIINNLSQCTNLQILHSKNNKYKQEHIQKFTRLRMLFSDDDEYTGDPSMIQKLYQSNQLEYVEIYGGKNIVVNNISLTNNISKLQFIYCTNLSFGSSANQNDKYTNPMNLRLCIKQFYSKELTSLYSQYNQMIKALTYENGIVVINNEQVNIFKKESVKSYLGNEKYFQLIHILQNFKEYFDQKDQYVNFAQKIILGGFFTNLTYNYKIQCSQKKPVKIMQYLKNYKQITEVDRQFLINIPREVNIRKINKTTKEQFVLKRDNVDSIKTWLIRCIYDKYQNSDIKFRHSALCWIQNIMEQPAKLFTTKYKQHQPNKPRVKQLLGAPFEVYRRKIISQSNTEQEIQESIQYQQPQTILLQQINIQSQKSTSQFDRKSLTQLVNHLNNQNIDSIIKLQYWLTLAQDFQYVSINLNFTKQFMLNFISTKLLKEFIGILRHHLVEFKTNKKFILVSQRNTKKVINCFISDKNVKRFLQKRVSIQNEGKEFDVLISDYEAENVSLLENITIQSLIYTFNNAQRQKFKLFEPYNLRSATLTKVSLENLDQCIHLENLCSKHNIYNEKELSQLISLRRLSSYCDEYLGNKTMLDQLFNTNYEISYIYVYLGNKVAEGAQIDRNTSRLQFFYVTVKARIHIPMLYINNIQLDSLQFIQVNILRDDKTEEQDIDNVLVGNNKQWIKGKLLYPSAQ